MQPGDGKLNPQSLNSLNSPEPGRGEWGLGTTGGLGASSGYTFTYSRARAGRWGFVGVEHRQFGLKPHSVLKPLLH